MRFRRGNLSPMATGRFLNGDKISLPNFVTVLRIECLGDEPAALPQVIHFHQSRNLPGPLDTQ